MSRVNITSSSGKLEGIYKKNPVKEITPGVILLHPHPLHGGNMHSKVVHTMEKAFFDNGFSTLKFNFRGVGSSEGEYSEGVEEIIDASCACDWMQKNHSIDPKNFWVAGFSFGAYIAIQAMMRRIEFTNFVSVGTPPPSMFDLSFIYPCPVDGLFIHAEEDKIANIKESEKVIRKAMKSEDKEVEYEVIHNSDHFFTNHLKELYSTLSVYISKKLQEQQ